MANRNVIVGQSGGPTAVINASLAGVYKTAIDAGYDKVYGMLNGVQGLLKGNYVDMSTQISSDLDLELLKHTPSAFLGSCRYKMPKINEQRDVFEKIFEMLDKLEIRLFVYIGGNDSMDTITKLSNYARENGKTQQFIGVPKTIDNDLALTDHCPGFGSAAKYIAISAKEIIRDCTSMGNSVPSVTIMEIMGRNAGWLTASSILARGEDCDGPDLIYLPEVVFDLERFKDKVAELLKHKNSVVVAVSEGVKTADGKYVCELDSYIDYVDSFGHKQLSGTGSFLSNYITDKLGCKSRSIEFSILQRCASHCVSKVDIDEAYMVGAAAIRSAQAGETEKMIVIDRLENNPYISSAVSKDVNHIANAEKLFPKEWIDLKNDYVKDEFIDYVMPLIQGSYSPIMVDGLPRHIRLRLD